MKRATKRHWQTLDDVLSDEQSLRYDWPRRMRNSLLILARSDPGWMWWIEKNVPLNLTLAQATRLIERQARIVTVRSYHFQAGVWLSIVYSDTPFSERGLLPG